ncbi:MAG: bifunctional pyr operon transcriptional regulator/uracil phosphoribosyltransferase PyrR [Desulfarculus sp.]|nr:MAG: bifunctional pyr operon transcriptional regulator/uracil phosphoribosyltransferase PyrR [Desulfarculus sp.]
MQPGPAQTVCDASQVSQLLQAMAQAVARAHPDPQTLCLVGIRTGGEFLARRLQKLLARLLGAAPDTGVMDITLYRDDWTLLHSRPKVGSTAIDFDIEGRVVVLVDDVLYTGRTVRAALDELMDFGRAQRIELAVLIDRGGRELPIQPNYMGLAVEGGAGEVIEVLLKERGHADDGVVRLARQA